MLLWKSNRKTNVMESFFSNKRPPSELISREFWIFFIEYLRVNTFVPLKLLWDLTGIMKAITVHLLLHFDSCPAELIMIWHTKQMSTLPNQLFQGVLWNNLAKKSQTFLGKYHPWSSVLITSQGNVSKTELRSRRSP